jgi:hypothetical protein
MALVAAGAVVLSGCGGDKSSGLATLTPGTSPSPTAASKWTPDQQQVIKATLAYRALTTKYARGVKLDRTALRSVATEKRAVQAEKDILGGLAFGFTLKGEDDVDEIRAVTITGAKSTLTECWIGRGYGVNKLASPPVTAKPSAPHLVRVNLTRSAGSWRVSGTTPGAACTAKG